MFKSDIDAPNCLTIISRYAPWGKQKKSSKCLNSPSLACLQVA